MKRVKFPLSRSKSAILLMFVAAGISMAIPACKKDDSTTSVPAVSQDDASVIVNQSLFASEGSGLQMQTDNAVSVTNNYIGSRKGAKIYSEDCGIAHADSLNLASDANTSLTYKYALSWNWQLTCSAANEPQSVAMGYNAKIQYTTSKMAARDSSVATFKVAGLEVDSMYLTINQTFDRKGSLTITSGDTTKSFSSIVSYKATNVKISKSTLLIVSGTADVSVSGTNEKGKAFSYSGTITYQGEYKALFAIKGGSSFNFTWRK